MELVTLLLAVGLIEAIIYGPAIYREIVTTVKLGRCLLEALRELEYEGAAGLTIGEAELALTVVPPKLERTPIGFL